MTKVPRRSCQTCCTRGRPFEVPALRAKLEAAAFGAQPVLTDTTLFPLGRQLAGDDRDLFAIVGRAASHSDNTASLFFRFELFCISILGVMPVSSL